MMKDSIKHTFNIVTVSLGLFGFFGVAQAGDRLEAIEAAKTIRVGTPGDYRPFSIDENGAFSGHDIELVQKMAEVYGWKVQIVKTSWPNLQKDFEANRFDVALGGITRTPARFLVGDFLPGYAPFGKVALINKKVANKLTSLEAINQPNVRVIKNPGGTNEQFVLKHLTKANVKTFDKNHKIPELIREGKGDVMITENAEAIVYSKKYPNELHAAFLDKPLTAINTMGFWIPTDDPDYTRVMNYLWDLMQVRGDAQKIEAKWLK